MKKKLKISLVGFLLMACGIINIHAQVTIGTNEAPASGALLQLKEKQNIIDGSANATGGLNLPRVALSKKKQLYPMFLANPEDPNSGPTGYYAANKAALDASHKGLIVYNLTDDDDEDLCLGINHWDGEQWNCLENHMGEAVFDPVNCSYIMVNGVYIENIMTTSANYLTIVLNVRKTGSYSIIATTENGYNFFQTGVALSVGLMTINLPAQGIPVNPGTDLLRFSGLTLAPECDPEVNVQSALAVYSLNCARTSVNGIYLKGTPLTGSNTMTVNVSVSTPGSYSIATPRTSGIRFSAKGYFTTTGAQLVTLTGDGTPLVNFDFPIAINANTPEGTDVCTATIPMTLPVMKYAVIGNGSTYSWESGPRRIALNNASSFAASTSFRILGLTELWATSTAGTAANHINNDAQKPDVILYNAYSARPNAALITALTNYVNLGGVLIFGSQDNQPGDVNDILNGVFGSGSGTAETQISGTLTSDNCYQIAILPEDPIVNGPFGNLSGKYWAEDNVSNNSIILRSLPPGSVQICSASNSTGKKAVDPDYSIVWYNNAKNFFYFGDSTGASTSSTSTTAYPSYFTTGGAPRTKLYGPNSNNQEYVYNSALELNAFVWAIKKAASSGINYY